MGDVEIYVVIRNYYERVFITYYTVTTTQTCLLCEHLIVLYGHMIQMYMQTNMHFKAVSQDFNITFTIYRQNSGMDHNYVIELYGIKVTISWNEGQFNREIMCIDILSVTNFLPNIVPFHPII